MLIENFAILVLRISIILRIVNMKKVYIKGLSELPESIASEEKCIITYD